MGASSGGERLSSHMSVCDKNVSDLENGEHQ
jgi:hypothetical protein